MSALLQLNFSVEGQETLKRRFEEIFLKNPHLKINVFSAQNKINKKKEISVNLLYLYDAKKHEGRKFESSGCHWLVRLTIEEVSFLNSMAVELAGEEFSVELSEVNMGIFTYCLIPKNLPA